MTAVIIRYQSLAANAVLTHRFQSVATCSSQAGDGKLLSKVMRFPSRRAPFGSIFLHGIGGLVPRLNRWQRVVRYSRCTNLFGPFEAARRFICSLHHLRQKSCSVFAVSFRPGPFVALAHGNHHDAGAQGNAQKVHGEIQNVEC